MQVSTFGLVSQWEWWCWSSRWGHRWKKQKR